MAEAASTLGGDTTSGTIMSLERHESGRLGVASSILSGQAGSGWTLQVQGNTSIGNDIHHNYRPIIVNNPASQITEQSLDEIRLSETSFSRTQEFEECLAFVRKWRIVILAGARGTGKTIIGQALLREFETEDFTPMIIRSYSDFGYHVTGKKQAILLENIFGRNEYHWSEWSDMIPLMKHYAEKGCYVIITARLNVLHQLMASEDDCGITNLPRFDLGLRAQTPASGSGTQSTQQLSVESSIVPPSSRWNENPSGTPNFTSNDDVYPISSLRPHFQRWEVKARLIQKSEIYDYEDASGEEKKRFSMKFSDKSGSIRAACFDVDKFYSQLEIGKVYHLSQGQIIKPAKDYEVLNPSGVELVFTRKTVIKTCEEVPSMWSELIPISDIKEKTPNSTVDVMGVMKDCSDVSFVPTKNGIMKKRNLTLVDKTGQTLVTLWENETSFDETKPVLGLKHVRVSDFNDRSLSVHASSSQLVINPETQEARDLRQWYDREGFSSSLDTCQVESPKKRNGIKTKAVYESTISCNLYNACPKCNTKVVENENGYIQCKKCARHFPIFRRKKKMVLFAKISHCSDVPYITCFDDVAASLLSVSAEELDKMNNKNYNSIFEQVLNKEFIFHLYSRMEHFQGTSRRKVVCEGVDPVK